MRLFLTFVLAFFMACGGLCAQTASQITLPSYRPTLENNTGEGLSLPQEATLELPKGADKLFVQLSGIHVAGSFEALSEATRALEAKLLGHRVSAAEIFTAARELEAAYANAGYILARVLLPSQKLVNGARLKLTVLDGFIESIDTQNVPELVRPRILGVLAPLREKHQLTRTEIERRVLLASDTPGVILQSTLAPGKATGAAILVIDVKHQPIDGVFSFDNTYSTLIGRWTMSVGMDTNSVGALGELVYMRANGHPSLGDNSFFGSDPRYRSLVAGFILPIGFDGLTFNMEAVDARTAPNSSSSLTNAAAYHRVSARLRYPWIRSRNFDLNTELDFDAENDTESYYLDQVYIQPSLAGYADRLRVFRSNTDADWISPWGGTLTGRVVASFGADAFGARSAAAAAEALNTSSGGGLSRLGTDATFQKLELFASYSQLLIDHLRINLYAHGQTSFGEVMANGEQIGLTSPTGLSSFNDGSLQGDSGAMLRSEIASPWSLPILPDLTDAVASPYVFAAVGEFHLDQATALETARIRAASYGVGVKLNGVLSGTLSNASFSFEYGRQAESAAPYRGDRFMIMGAIKF